MRPKRAGQGGRSKSIAKQKAARKNGQQGGRPSAAELLHRRAVQLRERLQRACPNEDPSELDLIAHQLCRAPDERAYFIFAREGGGYVF